jgi:hypothetical protein
MILARVLMRGHKKGGTELRKGTRVKTVYGEWVTVMSARGRIVTAYETGPLPRAPRQALPRGHPRRRPGLPRRGPHQTVAAAG